MSFLHKMNADNEEFVAAKKHIGTTGECINPRDFYYLGPEDFANLMHLHFKEWDKWYLTVYAYYKDKVKQSESREDWDLWVESGEFLSVWFNEMSRAYSTGQYWFKQ